MFELSLVGITVYLLKKQCDQLGLSLTVLCNNFYFKSSLNIWKLRAILNNVPSKMEIIAAILATLKNWATFYSNIWPHCQDGSIDFTLSILRRSFV